jgi:hemolysin III
LRTQGNFVAEELMNSVSHGLGFLLSVVGAILLMDEALASQEKTDYHFWACILFSSSLLFLFLASTLFHSFFMLPAVSRVLQTLDHVGQYVNNSCFKVMC